MPPDRSTRDLETKGRQASDRRQTSVRPAAVTRCSAGRLEESRTFRMTFMA